MKHLIAAAALALAASTATAEITVTIVDADETGYIGQIVHHNRDEFSLSGQEFMRFETDRGLFIILWKITENRLCIPACPDTIEIWEWPAGVIPEAIEATTAERDVSIIRLFEWSGM